MRSDIEFCEAEQSSWAAIDEIFARAMVPLRRIYRPQAQAIAVKTARQNEWTTWVAKIGGRTVGAADFKATADCLHVSSLAVDPAFQRQGVARSLLAHAALIAREQGLRILSLSTIEQSGNVPIFERLGFHVANRTPATWAESVRGETLVDVEMERAVS